MLKNVYTLLIKPEALYNIPDVLLSFTQEHLYKKLFWQINLA